MILVRKEKLFGTGMCWKVHSRFLCIASLSCHSLVRQLGCGSATCASTPPCHSRLRAGIHQARSCAFVPAAVPRLPPPAASLLDAGSAAGMTAERERAGREREGRVLRSFAWSPAISQCHAALDAASNKRGLVCSFLRRCRRLVHGAHNTKNRRKRFHFRRDKSLWFAAV